MGWISSFCVRAESMIVPLAIVKPARGSSEVGSLTRAVTVCPVGECQPKACRVVSWRLTSLQGFIDDELASSAITANDEDAHGCHEFQHAGLGGRR